MDQLLPKSDPGYADALFNLAKRYWYGEEGLELDKEKAVCLWKEAAEMDHLDSMYTLGYCYENGYGCEEDDEKAFYWYTKAAQRDHVKAMIKLRDCFEYGKLGRQKDLDQASYWYQMAIEHGHLQPVNELPPKSDPGYADALYKLGERYRYGRSGLERDKEKAVCLWKEAAEMDHLDSMNLLGNCYQYAGWGCEEDDEKAFYWHEKAAQRDHVNSMFELGICYKHGYGCKKDLDLALEWWEKVAQQENGPHNLYLFGWGRIEYDYSVGYDCLSIASKHGHKEALQYLLYYHQQSERGGTADEKIQKLRKIIQDDDPSDFIAVFLLAECLSNSFKLKDLDEATSLLATIPQDVTIYARSQWLVPFLEEKKNIICLSVQSGQSFPTESDYLNPHYLEMVALIGEGQFGKVYLAKYSRDWFNDEGRWVAVKYVNDNEFEEHQDAVIKLMRERLANQILKASDSRNTAQYMGIVTDFNNEKSGLVFELCADLSLVLEDAEDRIHKRVYAGGSWRKGESNFDSLPDWRARVPSSLRSVVVFAKVRRFSLVKQVQMFRDTGDALRNFHILGFLHRDLAARNVLCDENGNVQLADFGMARFVSVVWDFNDQTMLEYSHKLTEGNQYAVAWMPPECLGEEPIFSFASDVYSFAVMIWQCLAGEDPFQSLLEGDGDPFVRVSEAIVSGERPNLDKLRKETPARLRYMLEDCWAADPSNRPSLTEVISALDTILEEIPNQSTVILRRTGNQVERNWFDVESMYLEKPAAELLEEAQDAGTGSFQWSLLESLVTKKRQMASTTTAFAPCDVYIVHAGAETWMEALSLELSLERAGFRCCIEYGMESSDWRSVQLRELSLESCRFMVVIVSKTFLLKEGPCQALRYAFDRAQWIEGSSSPRSPLQSWLSLKVLLLDLSVKDYFVAQSDSGRIAGGLPPLPLLSSEIVMTDSARAHTLKHENWTTALETLGNELELHDKDHGSIDRWNEFLQDWEQLPEGTFPRARDMYRSETESMWDFGLLFEIKTIMTGLAVFVSSILALRRFVADRNTSSLHGQVAKKLENAASNKVLSEETITGLGGRRPYDVFIAHTGKEKWVEASTLMLMLELSGFRCFLDCRIDDNDGAPVAQMEFALETSRYIVVVISKAFLTKKYPCRELRYAFDRAQWLEGLASPRSRSRSWRSLRVILLDLSVDEYQENHSNTGRSDRGLPALPALGSEVVMEEFAIGQRKIEWRTTAEELGERLLRHDRDQGAVDCWNDFLKKWDSLPQQGFPRANNVYVDWFDGSYDQ